VRGSGIAGSVLLSVVILHELLSGMASIGVMMVIAGIATLSYKRNHAATSPKGIFMALVCGGFIMSYTIIDKMLVDVMHPLPVLAASQVFTLFLFLPYVITERKEEMRLTLRSLKLPSALISVIATTSYLIILYVMQMEDIGRIVTVREASVVFGALAGYVLLKEHFSKTRLIGVLLVMIGIVLVKL
jgi:drug/metabolite transporter (DMT)-like permease